MPSKLEVLEARTAAGLTQKQASELVHLGSPVRWAEYENGTRNIDAARWELFGLKVWLNGRKIRPPAQLCQIHKPPG